MATGGSTTATFASDFERVRERLPGAQAGWLSALRRDAIAELAGTGFPSIHDEDWKYTSVLPALRDRLEPVLPSEAVLDQSAAARLLALVTGLDPASPLLVFADGCFQPSLSRADAANGLRVTSLRARLESDAAPLERWLGKYLPAQTHGFAALNTAFLDDGPVIEIAEGAILEQPIHIVHLSTRRERPFITHPRGLVIAGDGSSSVVVEHSIGEAGARYLTNLATEITIGHGAAFGHVRVQDESHTAYHVARIQVEQAAGSTFVSHAFGFGAALSRTEIAVKLAGEEAECTLSGLYAMDGSRHVDHHLMVDHARPRTRSRQLYKGVLDDRSRGVFTGRVVVRKDSQKIKAVQNNPSLLLGAGAVSETRPQLEIYADDVACNHGATIGRLSEDSMFYLLSRGIDPLEARRVLVSGFAAEVVAGVVPESLRAALVEKVGIRMGELGRGGAS
ncbi:MAG TPA: Fe-S cluster assembly protein SufD [Candidatus Limnocylindrales bacterium]|nr:Fe-S cluster assembly protein SufD [Candidatus Limnocylindrales bacterium]